MGGSLADSAVRAPHGSPTLVQLVGDFPALGFFSGDLFGGISGNVRCHWLGQGALQEKSGV